MKKLLLSFAFIFVLISSANAEPIKRVLLEEYTGAWCGWCVDGTVIMHEMVDEYPDQVIGICLHNADKMTIPDEAIINGTMGITFFPSGSIDRKSFTGNTILDRGLWKSYSEEQMKTAPLADVYLFYSIDEVTRQLTATLNCTILEDISNDITFNVVVVEDSCSGTGTGWNQNNAYSNNSTYPNHPYYNLPSPILDYQHMNVVRAYLGGPWGISGELATRPYEIGKEYTHVFTYTLPEDFKIQHLKLVGLISKNDGNSKEVLNCCYGSTRPPALEIATVSPELGAVDDGEKFTRTFDVENISEVEHNLEVSITKGAKTPDDWTVELDKTALTVAPGTTGSFSVSITPGATVGFGDAKVTVKSTTDNEVPGVYGNIGAVSKSIEYFEVISKAETANTVLPLSTQQDNYIQVESKDFVKFYDVLPNLNTVIWNTGEADNLPPSASTALAGLAAKGVDVFMIGFNILPSLNTAGALQLLGIEYTGSCSEGYTGGSKIHTSFLKGVENDFLTGSMFTKIVYFDRTCQFTHVGKVTNPAIAAPILVFKNTQTVNKVGGGTEKVDYPDGIIAFRVTLGESKIVLLGINPNGLGMDTYKNQLINRPLEWFKGILDVENEGIVNSQISITPNPVETSANITLNINGSNSSQVRLSLFDALGQEVSVIHKGTLSPGQYSFPIESANLATGSYHIVFKNGVNVSSTSLMILK